MKTALVVLGVILVLGVMVVAIRLRRNLAVEQSACNEYDDWHKN